MENKVLICIGRQFGSGGHVVARAVGEKLGIPVYNDEIISKAAEESGYSKEYIAKQDEIKKLFDFSSFFTSGNYMMHDNGMTDNTMFMIQSKIIRDLANKGSGVFIGRCSDYILRDMPHSSIFITSSMANRITLVCDKHKINEKEASALINKKDKERETYYNYYTLGNWGDANNYDLCIDSGILGIEGTAEIIIDFVKKRTF